MVGGLRGGRAGVLAEVPEVERAGVAVAALTAVAVLLGGVVGYGRRGDLDAAVERADDAVGDGVGEAERRADGDRLVADVEVAGVGELDRLQPAGALELDDGEVDDRVDADDLGLVELAVVGGHLDGAVGRGALEGDDVGVGEHVAVGAEDDAGSGAARAAAVTEMVTTDGDAFAATAVPR